MNTAVHENDERYQLDETNLFIILNNSTCFGHLYAHRQEYVSCVLLRVVFNIHAPPGAWMFVSCKCCVLSGRGLCDGLITRPEESYRLWCVVVCDQET
jgi:hypothetical protein